MESDNFLLTVAVIAVLVSIVGLTTTYNSINTFENLLTGYATEYGAVNITITSTTSINITHAGGTEGLKNIDWGSGTVDTGKTYAILSSNNTIYQGSWGAKNGGFIVVNIGNTNVTLNITSDVDADDFIGGDTVTPLFQYNVSNYVADSCLIWNVTEATYYDFPKTATGDLVCSNFQTSPDQLRIDVLLRIPDNSLTDARNAHVLLIYEAVS